MGQAKQRGTREQRVAQAIEAGRIKERATQLPPRSSAQFSPMGLTDLVAALMICGRGRPRQRRKLHAMQAETSSVGTL